MHNKSSHNSGAGPSAHQSEFAVSAARPRSPSCATVKLAPASLRPRLSVSLSGEQIRGSDQIRLRLLCPMSRYSQQHARIIGACSPLDWTRGFKRKPISDSYSRAQRGLREFHQPTSCLWSDCGFRAHKTRNEIARNIARLPSACVLEDFLFEQSYARELICPYRAGPRKKPVHDKKEPLARSRKTSATRRAVDNLELKAPS